MPPRTFLDFSLDPAFRFNFTSTNFCSITQLAPNKFSRVVCLSLSRQKLIKRQLGRTAWTEEKSRWVPFNDLNLKTALICRS